MEMKRKNRKRLIFNVSEELHKEIKVRAAFRNISITDWLMLAITQRVQEERKYE